MSAINDFHFSDFIQSIKANLGEKSQYRVEKNIDNLKSIFDYAAANDIPDGKADVFESDQNGFLQLVQKGLNALRNIHVLGQGDQNDVIEGDYAVKNEETYKYENKEWKKIVNTQAIKETIESLQEALKISDAQYQQSKETFCKGFYPELVEKYGVDVVYTALENLVDTDKSYDKSEVEAEIKFVEIKEMLQKMIASLDTTQNIEDIKGMLQNMIANINNNNQNLEEIKETLQKIKEVPESTTPILENILEKIKESQASIE